MSIQGVVAISAIGDTEKSAINSSPLGNKPLISVRFDVVLLTALADVPAMTLADVRSIKHDGAPNYVPRRLQLLVAKGFIKNDGTTVAITGEGRAALQAYGKAASEPKIDSQDRDLLAALARCSSLTTDQAWKAAYGEYDRWYIYKRLKALERQGLLSRSGRQVFITQQGMVAAGFGGITPGQTRMAGTVSGDIFLAVARWGWEYMSSKIAKSRYGFYRGGLFTGVIRGRGSRIYLVYLLSGYPRKATVNKMRKEIADLAGRQTGVTVSGAIVLYGSEHAREAFDTAPQLQVPRLMMLRADMACSVLERFALEGRFLGLYGPALEGYEFQASNKTFADYIAVDGDTGEEFYVTELFTGDLNVRFTAGAYLKDQYKLEGRRLIVFCFERQLGFVAKYFKGKGLYRTYAVTDDWQRIRKVDSLPAPDAAERKVIQECFDW
jgi:hypothetical protein